MKITRRNRERGVALIAVLIAIAITIVISGEFGTATTTDISAAANYRDQMRAHFLARSAQNLGELVIQIQSRVDGLGSQIGPMQITDFADQLIMPFCGSPEEVRDMIGFSSSEVPGLGADVGTCGFNGPFTTEDNKINVNCANNQASFPMIQSALYSLMYFPAYDPVFEEGDAEGWHRDRMNQVGAILDYIDTDSMHLKDRGTSEDYGYESLKDHYLQKNNYIDTPGEIKLARGVDDRLWSLFGSAMTIYGGCKVNLSALDNVQLIAAVLYLAAKNPNDPVILDSQKLFALASIVAKAKQMGETFQKPQEFIDFVKDPTAAITAIAGQTSLAGSAANNALATGLMPGQKLGLDLDAKKLDQIATGGPRRTYRVEAYGEIARKQTDNQGKAVFPPVRATVTGVWDLKATTRVNDRKPSTAKGQWVYLRED